MKPISRIQGALLLMLIASLVSCATPDAGYKITDETIAFVQPGVTTRSEVLENLGSPLFELKEPPVVSYSWGKMRSTGARAAPVRSDDLRQEQSAARLEDPSEQSGTVESRRWVFCIALDANDRVKRVQKIELRGQTSLEQAVRAWAGSSTGR